LSKSYSIDVGEISGVFGLKGWVKIFSFTNPRENILSYSPLMLTKGDNSKTVEFVEGQRQGKTVVAHIKGVDTREGAEALLGWKISVDRSQLPEPDENEYYWTDLVGLKVLTTEGVDLGLVDHLLETGANDVLVVIGDRERLIPFVMNNYVIKVNFEDAQIIVSWDLDF